MFHTTAYLSDLWRSTTTHPSSGTYSSIEWSNFHRKSRSRSYRIGAIASYGKSGSYIHYRLNHLGHLTMGPSIHCSGHLHALNNYNYGSSGRHRTCYR